MVARGVLLLTGVSGIGKRQAFHLADLIDQLDFGTRIVSALQPLLAGPHPVVATVALRGTGFIEEVKRLKSILIWEVTRANRDKLPERVLAWLAAKVQPKV